jgi:predicted O-methyltransferase YrrM
MEHFYEKIEGYSRFEKQGLLLTELLNIMPDKKINIAEIGVFKGRGTAMWNVELINNNIEYDYYAIDHFLGSDEHNKNVDYHSITVNNLEKIKDKIKIIRNDSISESKNYDDEFFDIVYIDASHDYESVKADILAWLPKVKKGGVLCGDDYVPEWPSVKKAVNELLDDFKVTGYQWWYVKK